MPHETTRKLIVALLIAAVVGTFFVVYEPVFLTFELPKALWFRFVVEVAFVTWILRAFFNEGFEWPQLSKKIWTATGFFMATFVLATIFSIAPQVSFWGSYYRLQGLFAHLHYWLFFLIAITTIRKKDLEKITKTIVAAAILGSIFALTQKYLPILASWWDTDAFLGRIFGTFGHPNYLATVIAMMMPLTVREIIEEKTRTKKILWIASALIMTVALMATLSRAGMLACVAASGVFLFLSQKKSNAQKKSKKILAIMVAVVLAAGIWGLSSGRFTAQGENARSAESRLVMWSVMGQYIHDFPLLGSGPETFQFAFQKYAPAQLHKLEDFNDIPDRAHNEILDTLATRGILGLLAYGFWIFMLLSTAFRKSPPDSTSQSTLPIALGSSILALVVANQFGFSVTIHEALFWLIAGMTVVATSEKEHITLSPCIHRRTLRTIAAFFMLVAIFSAVAYAAVTGIIQPLRADLEFAKAMNPPEEEQGTVTQKIDHILAATKLFSSGSLYQNHGARMTLDILEHLDKIGATQMAITMFAPPAQTFIDAIAENSSNRDPYAFVWRAKYENLVTGSNQKANFQKAQILAPTLPTLYMQWGKVLLREGKKQEAAEKFQQYINLAPDTKHRDRIFYKLNPGFDEVFKLLADCKIDENTAQ